MSGLELIKYIPHVMLGTALVGALVVTPARFKWILSTTPAPR